MFFIECLKKSWLLETLFNLTHILRRIVEQFDRTKHISGVFYTDFERISIQWTE